MSRERRVKREFQLRETIEKMNRERGVKRDFRQRERENRKSE